MSDDIVVAWVSTCHKRRKADPTPMLSLFAQGVDPESGAAFARALVDLWIDLDNSGERTEYGQLKAMGTAHRGLLALAAALGDATLLALARAYITEHYGWRAAQSKAMVTMLAYVGVPETLQYLIQLATRFRTRGIQKHARAELDGVAARRGWTADELEDRTLLDGGLGEEGELAVAYCDPHGTPTRTFVLRLGATKLDVEVVDDTGKVLRGLPKARASEDPASVKAAKRVLSGARKQLRAFLKVQVARLQRAMVSERTWTAELFTEVVVRHPVLGRLAERLVWVDAEGRTLRPTEDGSLTDLDDDTVVLASTAEVRLAHPLRLDAETIAAWQEHLSDYEVVAPFDQLDRPVHIFAPDELKATALDTLTGCTINALTLRGRAAKVGFDLGPTGDGGYVDALLRAFPRHALVVRIAVEDLRLPVDNTDVTLGDVTFAREGQDVSLAAVPAVVRSEVWVDLQTLLPT